MIETYQEYQQLLDEIDFHYGVSQDKAYYSKHRRMVELAYVLSDTHPKWRWAWNKARKAGGVIA